MSAIAIFCTDSEINLLCDGLQTHLDTDQVLSQSAKKIYTVNDRCAVLNMGWGGEDVQIAINSMKKDGFSDQAPEAVALYVGMFLKQTYKIKNIEPVEFMHLVVGYNSDGIPELWELFNAGSGSEKFGFQSDGNPYNPVQRKFKPGSALAIAVGMPADQTSFSDKLQEKISKGRDDRSAASLAFNEMVAEYAQNGHGCGGTIFQEIIKSI